MGATLVLAIGLGACASSSDRPSQAPADASVDGAHIADAAHDEHDSPDAPCTVTADVGALVHIPAGTFVIGAPDGEFGKPPFNQNQVQVTLTHAFELGATELTVAQWRSLCFPNPNDVGGVGADGCVTDDCPVAIVTWFDAVAWLNALSAAKNLPECYELQDCTGSVGRSLKCQSVTLPNFPIYECQGYRLPTEYEWEYAYRAGTTTAFYSGDITPVPAQQDPDTCIFDANLDKIGWYCFNSGTVPHRVAQKTPNSWGLHDMSGNIPEWTHSRYTANGYGSTPLVDPPGTAQQVNSGDSPSRRGGLFNFSSRSARAAWRGETPNWAPGGAIRIARTLPTAADAGSDGAVSDAGGD